MKYMTYEIKPGENYLFSIGVRSEDKPDSDLKDWIERSINEAMENLKFDFNTPYYRDLDYTAENLIKMNNRWQVQVIHEPGSQEMGEEDIEMLNGQTRYIMFGILYSQEGEEQKTNEELEEITKETAEKIKYLKADPEDDNGGIGLIILQDCTVNRRVIAGYSPPMRIA